MAKTDWWVFLDETWANFLDETWANAHDRKDGAWVEKDTAMGKTLGGVQYV